MSGCPRSTGLTVVIRNISLKKRKKDEGEVPL
jgi:hypothetical protein